MGKTCLNKLTGNILTSCGIPTNGVKDLYLMHAEDVGVTLDAAGGIATVVFPTGTRSYRIEGFKQNIQITSAIRTLEASAKIDFSVMFKIPSSVGGASVNANGGFITVTLTAPEGSAGNYRRSITQALASTIIAKSA